MKLRVTVLLSFLSVLLIHGQTVPPEYDVFIKKADSLLNLKEYKNAGLAFSSAFKTLGNKGRIPDRYTAARAWAMAGILDSSFVCLEKIVFKKFYTDYKTLENEKDFQPLHSNSRWQALLDFIKTDYEAGLNIINAVRLDTKIPVLNNKVSFVFPLGSHTITTYRTTRTGINYPDRETFVQCKIGSITMTFRIEERMTFGDKKLFEGIRTQKGFITKVLTDKDGIYSELYVPIAHPRQQVGSLLVKMPDRTMFHVSAEISNEGYQFQDELSKLAEQVLKSLKVETRKTPLNEHTETWNIFETTKSFVATIPKNYGQDILEWKRNPSQTTTFQKYTDFGSKAWASVSIETGLKHNYEYRRWHYDSTQFKIKSIKFLGNNVDFMFFYKSKIGFQLAEAIIPRDDIKQGFKIHVSFITNEENSIKELIKLIESIKLVPETSIELNEVLAIYENVSGIQSLVPNPTQDIVTINYAVTEKEQIAEIILTNYNGEIIKTITVNTSESKIQVDCSSYNSGVYFTTLNIDGKPVDTKKLIISK